MKKHFTFALILFFILLSFSACSKKAGVSDDIIAKDAEKVEITYATEYITDNSFDYISHKVIKRQTNIEDKEDIIFLESHYKNGYFEIIADVTLQYNFYDEGGWILEDETFEITNSRAISSPNFESFFEKLYSNRHSYIHCNYNGKHMLTNITDIICEGVDFNIDSQSSILKVKFVQGDIGEINAHYLFEYSLETGWSWIEDTLEGQKYGQHSAEGRDSAYMVAKVDNVNFDFEHTAGNYGSLKVSNINMENLTADVAHGGSAYGDWKIKKYNLDPFKCELYINGDEYAETYQYSFSSKKWH